MSTETIDIKVAKIHRLTAEGHLKAFVDISINDAILIKGIRVVDGKKGIFVSMPSEQGKDEKWYETVRCLNQDMRSRVTQKVLEAYNV
jgi:stage V sporulation protein G